jgi:RecJ-like exonuclease
MYQQCPTCEGEGVISASFHKTTHKSCPTCKGERIIHQESGKPPSEHKEEANKLIVEALNNLDGEGIDDLNQVKKITLSGPELARIIRELPL